jgi:hypothetical protein
VEKRRRQQVPAAPKGGPRGEALGVYFFDIIRPLKQKKLTKLTFFLKNRRRKKRVNNNNSP